MFQAFYTPKSNAFYVINISNSLVSGWTFNCIKEPLTIATANMLYHVSNKSILTYLQTVNPTITVVSLGTYKSIDDIVNSNPHLLI